MKVVYNTCFGGFELSRKAQRWLAERGVVAAADYINRYPDGSMYADSWCPDQDALARHDSLLVRCVEELGGRRGEAAGPFAALKICHVPDGAPYEISEYDGSERVVAPTREYS